MRGGLPGKGHQHQAAEIGGGRLALRIRIAPRAPRRTACARWARRRTVGAPCRTSCPQGACYKRWPLLVRSRSRLRNRVRFAVLKASQLQLRGFLLSQAPFALASRAPVLAKRDTSAFKCAPRRRQCYARRCDLGKCIRCFWCYCAGAIKTQTYRVFRPRPARPRPIRAFRARFALRAHVTRSLPLRFALVSLRLKLC